MDLVSVPCVLMGRASRIPSPLDSAATGAETVSSRIRWPRVFIEGVVIVSSVLLAFGIQAWWEGRQERVLERDALERLEAEFAEVDAVLQQWRDFHQAKVDVAEILLSHTGPDGYAPLPPDSVANLVGVVRVAYTVNLPFANLSALEASGQFATIQDLGLLTELSRFRAIVEDLQDDEQRLGDILLDHLTPYLYTATALRNMPVRTDVFSETPTASQFSGGFGDILGSREFENMVIDVQRRSANIVGNYDVAMEQSAALSAIVRRNLGR